MAVVSKRTHKFDDTDIGDVVMRGVDWQWGEQDGGEGSTGVVVEITRWKVKKNGCMDDWTCCKIIIGVLRVQCIIFNRYYYFLGRAQS